MPWFWFHLWCKDYWQKVIQPKHLTTAICLKEVNVMCIRLTYFWCTSVSLKQTLRIFASCLQLFKIDFGASNTSNKTKTLQESCSVISNVLPCVELKTFCFLLCDLQYLTHLQPSTSVRYLCVSWPKSDQNSFGQVKYLYTICCWKLPFSLVSCSSTW